MFIWGKRRRAAVFNFGTAARVQRRQRITLSNSGWMISKNQGIRIDWGSIVYGKESILFQDSKKMAKMNKF